MADQKAQDMVNKLMVDGFQHTSPATDSVSDPVVDTPMVLTLDQLRPYDLNPRVTRNPLYDDIKASIRERGLDAPPAVTRRPGEPHYMIRSGGNTRLAILRELWSETRDERFLRIACLFRPWSQRGEIVALTGHLAENELHGRLNFIERALGVDKARELYEQETQTEVSQTELAKRLSADGYPVSQSLISRMRDCIHHLLPAVPNLLYAGLGRPQIERLTMLRRAAERVWTIQTKAAPQALEFDDFYRDTLSQFDAEDSTGFHYQRIQDELIGQMAQLLGMEYDSLMLEVLQNEQRQQLLHSHPQPEAPQSPAPTELPAFLNDPPPKPEPSTPGDDENGAWYTVGATAPKRPTPPAGTDTDKTPGISLDTFGSEGDESQHRDQQPGRPDFTDSQAHDSTAAFTTPRLQDIQQLVGNHLDADLSAHIQSPRFPAQADSLYPVTDIWHIDASLDAPQRLRTHIAQFALEIFHEAGDHHGAIATDDGLGFICQPDDEVDTPTIRAVTALLQSLSKPDDDPWPAGAGLTALLITGLDADGDPTPTAGTRLSDDSLIKLFRMIRLARRLHDLDTQSHTPDLA